MMIDLEKAVKTVRTFKAQPIVESEPVQSVTVEIDQAMPKFKDLTSQHVVFLAKAEELEHALYNSLPGGLYDRLLGAMLRRKSSHFIVAFGGRDEL
jgi:hypothetical protein